MRTAEQTGAAPHAGGPAEAIIAGSTRPGRKGDRAVSRADGRGCDSWRHGGGGGFPADGGEVT